MAPAKGRLLANTDFPLYAVRALGDRHFLVAGGGGQAKTGVPNAIEIYEVKLVKNQLVASSLCRYDTGIQAVMNCATFYDGRHHNLATGQDDECHTYSLKYKVVIPELKKGNTKDESVRKRKGDDKKEKHDITKQVTFDIQHLESVRSDFDKDNSFQKVVRFGSDDKLLATGGADGFLRVWNYPDMKKVYEVKAHKSDIDDLAFSPDGKHIVTISREANGKIWNAKEGSENSDLVWGSNSQQYRFRCCRYGVVENQKSKFSLYTVSIPSKRDKKPQNCYLTMWDGSKYKVKKKQKTGTEILSSLAVSDDGIYLGVGMISGSVAVYISFSLQKLYYVKEVHSIFVTGVDFLSASEGARAVTGSQDFTMLSVSADNSVRIHQVPVRGSFSIIWIVVGALLLIYLMFWLMSTIGI
ncbi:prolactin regulatory element-binding protein-like [Gigantopelta aegis]|uniref:prolactin regulatory element-binding protein-like n=1 Tax=Gigantopelta aegis TaxID=1735272 RepID=UPI001B88CFCF|nr:prolactin regulatory element-binding protein-like [Gigantopelta aegis]